MDTAEPRTLVPTLRPISVGPAVATRKALLLMRQTPVQMFCANTLFREGIIDCVYIEEGSTGEPDGWAMAHRLWRYGPVGIWKRISRDLGAFEGRLGKLLAYYLTRLRTRELMGRQAWHEGRMLGVLCRRLDPALPVVRGLSVNESRCRRLIQERGDQLVFVFGTGLLRDEILRETDAAFVNLHHGWLPRFRGEGIIAALAEEGIDGLGVTVHLVDRGVDTGPILYRERLMIERGDNAYAVALRATLRGVSLFRQVYQDAQQGPLSGIPQDSKAGRLYSALTLKRSHQMRLAAAKSLAAIDAPRMRLSRVKQLAAQVALAGGLTVLSRKRHGHRLRMLMYHGVLPRVAGPAAFGNLFLDLEMCARHLHYLARHFTVISFDEILACLQAGRPFPERALAITFDDGYRSLLAYLLPLARRHRLPIAVFVPAGDITEGTVLWFDVLRVLVDDAHRTRHAIRVDEELVIDGWLMRDPEAAFAALSRRILLLPAERAERVIAGLLAAGQTARVLERYPEFCLAGWEEWRAALTGGGLTVGSHGWTHRDLTQLASAACEQELRRTKDRIERAVGQPCRVVAYPYGAWNQDVAEAARRAGYESGVTTDPGLSTVMDSPWRLHRDTVGHQGAWALFCVRASGLLEPRDRS